MCDTGKPTKASGWRRQDQQEHKEKITAAATVNPNDWQLAPLTDEALESTAKPNDGIRTYTQNVIFFFCRNGAYAA